MQGLRDTHDGSESRGMLASGVALPLLLNPLTAASFLKKGTISDLLKEQSKAVAASTASKPGKPHNHATEADGAAEGVGWMVGREGPFLLDNNLNPLSISNLLSSLTGGNETPPDKYTYNKSVKTYTPHTPKQTPIER